MYSLFRRKIYIIILWLLLLIWCILPLGSRIEAAPPKVSNYIKWVENSKDVVTRSKAKVESTKSLRDNIIKLFYPDSGGGTTSMIYPIIRDISLWVMIIFIVRTGASLLLNNKPEESKKHLSNLLYIILWWVFIFWANRLFWSVFSFTEEQVTVDKWIEWVSKNLIWEVFRLVLTAVKAFAFFFAIIMTAVTWFKVISAGEWEKWKKLVKWLINIVVALMIIKWVDFIYYIAADTGSFVTNAENFIKNAAKVFAYIYWIVIVIMVIVAWYLYITDGWSGANFKKASNVLINILLSAFILFGFLLILYQIFAEFSTWWDAVSYVKSIKNYV